MRFDIDRLSKLAGLSAGKPQQLTEASNRSMHDDPSVSDDADWRYGKNQLAEVDKDQDKDPDELIEIDEVELVQELRRAKKLMNESRLSRRRQVSEHAELKNIIEEEVANVMSDFNLTSQWVYGNRKPTFSRKGRITTSMPGIGFGKKW